MSLFYGLIEKCDKQTHKKILTNENDIVFKKKKTLVIVRTLKWRSPITPALCKTLLFIYDFCCFIR